ncbi:hypothetical protein KJ854_03615 [Patescibacteria group bacterium]|nr:hypothetical protein [Patescibacteria group bacterium]
MAGLIIITIGLIIDLVNCVLGIKRINGNGPSGIPLIPFVFYAIGIFLLKDLSMAAKLELIVLSFFVHLLFLWFIVYLISKVIYKNK